MAQKQHAPKANLDAVVYSLDQFRDWIYTAERGELCLYHIGSMVIDQETQPALKDLGDYAALMSDLNVVLLNQARRGPNLNHYLARRTQRIASSIPKLVGTGVVPVRSYICLRAIQSRDANQSVKRAIRDVMSCSEQESSEIFNHLVKCGFIIEGRPPVITDAGAGVLM